MRHLVLAFTLVALPVLTIADQSADGPRQRPHRPVRISAERIEAIRQSLVAQIAVYDQAEGAVRAPSEQEAAALSGPAAQANASMVLPGGGMALKTDAAQLSFAVATLGEDGSVRISHADGARPAQTGGRHVR